MKTYKYIKNVRERLGLTQAQFGKKLWPKLNIALARSRIAKYESQKVGVNVIPPGDTLLKIQEIDQSHPVRSPHVNQRAG